jgi:hypothetical protein
MLPRRHWFSIRTSVTRASTISTIIIIATAAIIPTTAVAIVTSRGCITVNAARPIVISTSVRTTFTIVVARIPAVIIIVSTTIATSATVIEAVEATSAVWTAEFIVCRFASVMGI